MEMKEILRKLREDAGLTAKQLGAEIGAAESTVLGYEGGFRKPKDEMLHKYADYFNVTVDYLLGRKEKMSLNYFERLIQEDKVDLDGEKLNEFEKKHLLAIIRGLRDK